MLELSKIQFGKIDAHNELQAVGNDFYIDAFLNYSKYQTESFINGEKYYICGNKGTGKTALLKYLECKFASDSENLVIPIRFKSQFDNEDKKSMNRVASNIHEDTIAEIETDKTTSFVLIWKVYIIHQIFKNAEFGEYNVFREDSTYQSLKKMLKVIYDGQSGRIVPKLTKGLATLSASFSKGLSSELKVEIDFDEKTGKINFSKAAKAIISQYSQLEYGTTPVYILFDELELSIKSKKLYSRDVQLVRDLILAIDQLNGIAKMRNYAVKIVASIRNDVINSVLSSGYEINKSIEDFGVKIEWFQKGGTYTSSPLLKLIENKIHASEKQNGLPPSEDIWETYFESKINAYEVRKYILNYSWQRPRDIIRMMNIVQNQHTDEKKFTQEMFDRAMQQYSERSWNEISEELALIYPDKDDMTAIKKFFTGISVPFSLAYLKERAEELGEIYDCVRQFFEKYKMVDFLENMFEWGVIGNSGARMIFKFLGDSDLSLADKMIIHLPLRNFFAVKSQNRNNRRKDKGKRI